MIPKPLEEKINSIIRPEDFRQAEIELAELEKAGRMYLAKDSNVYSLQLKVFAMGIYARNHQAPTLSPEVSQELQAVWQEQDIAKVLVGPNSIHSTVSYSQRSTRKTKVLTYLFDDFHFSSGINLLILGGVGSGKTFGAIAYVGSNARLWLHRGNPVVDAVFVRAYTVGEMLQRKQWDQIDDLRNKKWLIIDDLGIEGAGYKSKDFHSFFEDLFIHRHEQQKRTLMTSNATLEQVQETLGDRFLSRLRETGDIFQTDDPDMRAVTHD